MIAHQLLTMEHHTEPSGSTEWGPLERWIAHCACGWTSGECYPEATATELLRVHVDGFIPGIPKPPGTKKIKLSSTQVGWLCEFGPWPFVVNQNTVEWREHTEAEVIAYFETYGPSRTLAQIVRKLMGEIE